MEKAKNYFKKTYADKKVNAQGRKLSEKIGKGINENHKDKVLKVRLSETLMQIRMPETEKIAFADKCGPGNASQIARKIDGTITSELFSAFPIPMDDEV